MSSSLSPPDDSELLTAHPRVAFRSPGPNDMVLAQSQSASTSPRAGALSLGVPKEDDVALVPQQVTITEQVPAANRRHRFSISSQQSVSPPPEDLHGRENPYSSGVLPPVLMKPGNDNDSGDDDDANDPYSQRLRRSSTDIGEEVEESDGDEEWTDDDEYGDEYEEGEEDSWGSRPNSVRGGYTFDVANPHIDEYRTLVANVRSVDRMVRQLNEVVHETKKVGASVNVYRNQEALVNQTNDFEGNSMNAMCTELHNLRLECAKIKSTMRRERMQAVVECNDDIAEGEKRLAELKREDAALDAQIAGMDVDIHLLEQYTMLHDYKRVKAEHKLRHKAKAAAGSSTGDAAPEATTQSLLANDVLFKALTTLPTDERVDAFLNQNKSEPPTQPKTLRTLANHLPLSSGTVLSPA